MDDMAERKDADMTEEYISRKSVRDAIASLSIERFELSNAYRLYVEALDNVDKKVVKIPAADVEPVRHGQWSDGALIDPKGTWRINGFYCSVCGELCVGKAKYCPNCGAKMDGGKNV